MLSSFAINLYYSLSVVFRQYSRQIFSYTDRMLKMSVLSAIKSHCCPFIRQNPHLVCSSINHRLYRKGHPLFQPWPLTGRSEIWHLRILMHLSPYAMPHEHPYHGEPFVFN